MESAVDSGGDLWNKVFRKEDQVVSRQIAGETILVPIRGKLADMQRIFSLDSVAEYIWLQLDGKRSLKDIRDGVLDAFDVEKEQAEVDISEFIDQLQKADLITTAK